MKKITVGDKTFRTYIPFEEFSKDFDRVAAQLNADFANAAQPPVFICTLNGAMLFTSEIMQRVDFPVELSSIRASSYIGTHTTGKVNITEQSPLKVKGRTVVVLEDIIDTGHTMKALIDVLKDEGAAEIRLCTLFFKPESFQYKGVYGIDYIAREIQNQFIVGFGLDYNELGRNSKDIYILDE